MKARSLASALLLFAVMAGCGGGASSSPTTDSNSRSGTTSNNPDDGTSANPDDGTAANPDEGSTAGSAGQGSGDPGEAGSSSNPDNPGTGGTSGEEDPDGGSAAADTGSGGAIDEPDGSTEDGVGGVPATGGEGGETSDGVGGVAGETSDGVGGDTTDGVGGDTGDGVGGDTGDGVGGDTGDGVGGDTGDGVGGDTGDGTGGNTGDGPPPCFPTFMDGINVLVFEDATLSGADTEGRLYVGGDANLSWAVGPALTVDCEDRQLVVDGDLTWTTGSARGLVTVGGEVNISSGVGLPCGVERNADAFDFETARQELTEYSEMLATFPQNGTVTNSNGALNLVGTDPEVNTFNLTAAQLSNIHTLTLDVPDGAAVIINVSGTDVTLASFGFGEIGLCREGGDDCHQVIWNLYEAETLTISGVGIQGSILAVNAATDFSNGMIDGQLIVESLTGSGEHHPYMFTGCYELEL